MGGGVTGKTSFAIQVVAVQGGGGGYSHRFGE